MEEKKEKQIINSQAEGTAPEEPAKTATPKGSAKADASKEPAKAAAPEESLKAALAKQAIEEEASGSASFTLRKILGGDILTAQIIRKQIWLFVLIVFYKVLHKMASRKTITTSAETIITISAAMMRTATSSLMETSVLVQRTMFAQAAMVVAEALHRRRRVLPSNRRSRTPRVPVIANMLQW